MKKYQPGEILKAPAKYPLADVIRELMWSRPGDTQTFLLWLADKIEESDLKGKSLLDLFGEIEK